MNSKQHPGTRDFPTLRAALLDWAKLNDRQEVWSEIERVIQDLEQKNGAIVRVHIPPAENYVAVTFANDPEIGAYINVGHIDHWTELPNTFIPDSTPYFRSYRSTSQGQTAGQSKGSKPNFLTCMTLGSSCLSTWSSRVGWSTLRLYTSSSCG